MLLLHNTFLEIQLLNLFVSICNRTRVSERSTESRIGFKTKVALEVVGKVTDLTDLRTSKFSLQSKKTALIFHLLWSSCQSMGIYRSHMQVTGIMIIKPLPSHRNLSDYWGISTNSNSTTWEQLMTMLFCLDSHCLTSGPEYIRLRNLKYFPEPQLKAY